MPTDTIEGFPLSLQQKRSWSLRHRGESELISEAEYRLAGPLDRAMFDTAIARVIQRHEICRSVYKTIPGLPQPVQILQESCELKPAGNSRRLEQSPIFDWELKQMAGDEHRLKIRFPALAADFPSLRLFMEDIAAQYHHVTAGSKDDSEPMQFLDYTQWQTELQETSESRSSHQYWKNLSSDQAGYVIPLERGEKGFATGCEVRTLSQEAVDQLKNSGTAIESVVCAAWAAFCARLAEINERILIGVTCNGRSFEELQKAIGPYDRVLPIEINARPERTAKDWINVLVAGMKSGRQHQEFYSGELLSASDAREGGFVFQFAARDFGSEVRANGLTFEMAGASSHSEPYKLKLEFYQGQSATLRLYYNLRTISSEYATILADRFHAFLNDFSLRPEVPASELKFASAREIELVGGSFGRSSLAEPKAPTVIESFQAEVTLHPQRPAVICDGVIMTYAELDERTNRLANKLIRMGVRAGDPVAISAERSCEMIIGLLGIQKAGGAYVPLDPSYPKDRLAQVLEDSSVKVLVTQSNLIGKLPAHQCTVVLIGESSDGGQDGSFPAVQLNPESPAYIIYTSGSTGRPKGVPITHRQLAISTAARLHYYQEPIANYLLLSSFAFDSSIAGIFWSLVQGGTLTIPREGLHQDPHHLLSLIRDYKVSHLLALPSFYQAILEQAVAREVASLTTVIVAGEACSPELVQRHYAKLPKAQLYNEYGPTEGTVWSTVYQCEPNVHGAVPIGRPVPNMSVAILNDRMEPVGIGQLGELCISGEAVASGYLNRPDLTSEKFVQKELSGVATRYYRTGDLACYREDGLIEFHGRIDEQVKIRGYRIEMGEIEHVVGRHPDVSEAVVVAREESPDEKRLVAYVVPKEQARLSIPEVRLFVQEKLPPFMVPAQFIPLKTFPLTPNGKIDRKALPAPDELDRVERKLLAPRNCDEEQLAKIWTEVLKLEKVGVEENFFDLGGHSLLAIQVIARVRDFFKLELPMSSFFETPTIGGMAVALGRCREQKGTGSGGIRRVARVAATDEILAKLNSNPG